MNTTLKLILGFCAFQIIMPATSMAMGKALGKRLFSDDAKVYTIPKGKHYAKLPVGAIADHFKGTSMTVSFQFDQSAVYANKRPTTRPIPISFGGSPIAIIGILKTTVPDSDGATSITELKFWPSSIETISIIQKF